MRIASGTKLNTCYWVDADRLEQYWQGDSLLIDYRLVHHDTRDPDKRMPHNGWFEYNGNIEREAFVVPAMIWNSGAGSNKIGFDNGRHRLRWMMSHGLKEIPVSIPDTQIDLFSSLELVIRKIEADEILPLPLRESINTKYESLSAMEI
jgi:hypothetical protein